MRRNKPLYKPTHNYLAQFRYSGRDWKTDCGFNELQTAIRYANRIMDYTPNSTHVRIVDTRNGKTLFYR